jgi:hypothetical protein
MILGEADRNKDGKLAVAECLAMFKDRNVGTQKCGYWDANKDGVITEDEYVKQASAIGGKKP